MATIRPMAIIRRFLFLAVAIVAIQSFVAHPGVAGDTYSPTAHSPTPWSVGTSPLLQLVSAKGECAADCKTKYNRCMKKHNWSEESESICSNIKANCCEECGDAAFVQICINE